MASRVLLRTRELTFGEFTCPPGDPLWDEVNTNIGAQPHVVFPRTRVLIAQDGARPVLATPNHVIFYRAHQQYRRGLRDARGDRSLWLAVEGELPEGPAGPSGAGTYLLAVAVARHLVAEPSPDLLVAEEAVVRLLDEAVAAPAGAPDHRRAGTRRQHAELAEAAKELLAARMAEPLSLQAIAAALYVSPFHLARVFRARTGFSLSGYVHGLRLRRAVDRLAAEPDTDLSRLAVDLGYCSLEPLQRPLPGRLRAPAVGAARRATGHDRGSGAPRRRLEPSHRPRRTAMRRYVGVAIAALALAAPAAAADDGFVERVRVLQEWHGEPNGYFGWAVSELTDIDHDRVTDVIVGEPNTPAGGTTWVFSGRTGRMLHRFDGQAGDFQGNAIADAGDTNRDGVNDIVSGASSGSRAYLYSGRSGRLLHTWQAEADDTLGSAVAGAGDQDRDGYDDVLVGAQGDDTAGQDAGAAYVYSGRTYEVLRRLDGPAPGAGFGSGTDRSDDLLRDRLIVGALNEGPAAGGGAHVFRGGFELFSLAPPAGAAQFGNFFVAGVGRVDGDLVPDFYAGDYAAQNNNGFAGVYSGRDGSLIHGWPGGPSEGTGPGREAGDVDRDGRVDLAVGSYTAGPTMAGRVDVRSGRTGGVLRTITSTTANENLGFDAVGVGDVNRDRRPDLLLSAAEGDTVYVVAGR